MAETPLSILWLLDLQPRFGIRHGATLRWLHFSRELVERGHSVCLSVNEDEPGDLEASSALLEEYRLKGWLTSHATTRYRFPSATGRRAHLRVHPTLTNQALASFQDETATRVRSLIEASRVDVVIISQRKLLFLAPRLGDRVPVVVDWMDSLVLHESRLARSHFRHGAWRETTGACKRMAQAVLQERHYGRRSSANILVSPVDLGLFNRLTGRPDRGRLLLNGVDSRPHATPVPKQPSRMIFTGAMDAPQNHEAALWFIEEVLPRVLRERPDAEFVIAGRDPKPELRQRAGPHVRILGEVQDLAGEIARSTVAVAPLRSGCGFKNKVVEALAAGTFVVGTGMATEFLPEALRQPLLASDSAEGLARHVLTVLEDPGRFEPRLADLSRIVTEEFSWKRRTRDLLDILATATADRPGAAS